jgi:hypothetical protein
MPESQHAEYSEIKTRIPPTRTVISVAESVSKRAFSISNSSVDMVHSSGFGDLSDLDVFI